MQIAINPEKQIYIICPTVDEFNTLKSWLVDIKLVRHEPVRIQSPGELVSTGPRGNVVILSQENSYDEFQAHNLLQLKERNTVAVAKALVENNQINGYSFFEYMPPAPPIPEDSEDLEDPENSGEPEHQQY